MEWQRLAGEHWGQCKSTESVFISISLFFFLFLGKVIKTT